MYFFPLDTMFLQFNLCRLNLQIFSPEPRPCLGAIMGLSNVYFDNCGPKLFGQALKGKEKAWHGGSFFPTHLSLAFCCLFIRTKGQCPWPLLGILKFALHLNFRQSFFPRVRLCVFCTFHVLAINRN